MGTDSHTTMINGLGVLGWGVGGIEAEAAMLGQPVSMLLPQVVGFRLTGALPEGATATDLVLTVTQMLRAKGVVGKFVEFYGDGLANLPLADRATIGNMSPEYGATCGIFPVDRETLRYLEFTGRPPELVALVEAYTKEQGLFHDESSEEATYSDTLELDMSTVEPSLAGPKRPQDRVLLREASEAFREALASDLGENGHGHALHDADEAAAESFPASDPPTHMAGAGEPDTDPAPQRSTTAVADEPGGVPVTLGGESFKLRHGAVVIAAITSCTNTSNPSVMVGAGLLAKKAVERGLQRKPWVKTSLAPGSKVVTEYLDKAGLTEYLEQLRFNLVGYGCTTCIGNSGPLPAAISEAITERRPGGLLGAVRQPQLRGPHPPRGADELPRQPAAGGGLRAGRPHGHRPVRRAARRGQRRRARLPARHLALAAGDPRHDRAVRAVRDVPAQLRRGVRGRRELARARRAGGRPLRLGPELDLRQAPALLRGHAGRAAGRLRADPRRARARRCSATASPPTTSPRPARSRRTRPPAPTCSSTAWSRRTSTPTARAAATTR